MFSDEMNVLRQNSSSSETLIGYLCVSFFATTKIIITTSNSINFENDKKMLFNFILTWNRILSYYDLNPNHPYPLLTQTSIEVARMAAWVTTTFKYSIVSIWNDVHIICVNMRTTGMCRGSMNWTDVWIIFRIIWINSKLMAIFYFLNFCFALNFQGFCYCFISQWLFFICFYCFMSLVSRHILFYHKHTTEKKKYN